MERNIFVPLSKKLVPSVVNIQTVSTIKPSMNQGGPEDLFRKFFEDYFRHQQQGGGQGVGPRGGGDQGGGEDDDQDMAPPPGKPVNRPKRCRSERASSLIRPD